MIDKSFVDELGSPLIIATHMRSGTHLTIDFIRRQFSCFQAWKWPGEANDMLYLSLDVLSVLHANWGEDRARRILRRPSRPLIKTHWTDPGLMRLREKQSHFTDFLEEKALFLHVIRHPLRVLESMWAWDVSQGSVTAQQPDSLWLNNKVDYWVWHTQAWMARPNIVRIRFEDLIANPSAVLSRLEDLLGGQALWLTPLLPPKLRGIWHSRCNRLLAVRPASTEILTVAKAATYRGQFLDQARNVLDSKASSLMSVLDYRL